MIKIFSIFSSIEVFLEIDLSIFKILILCIIAFGVLSKRNDKASYGKYEYFFKISSSFSDHLGVLYKDKDHNFFEMLF